MTHCPTLKQLTHSQCWCFLVAIVVILTAGPVLAQEASEAGKAEIERRGFNWYEDSEQSVQDLWRYDPGRAKSLQRREIAGKGPASETNKRNFNFSFLNGFFELFSTGTWIIIGIVLAVLLGIIIWLCLNMEALSGSNDEPHHSLDEKDLAYRIEQLPFQMTSATKGDLKSLAMQAANRGDYGRAVMLLFSHVLILLDRKDLIRLKKGKTNRQYINEIRQHPDLVNYYEQVMVPFEDSFFGDHTLEKSRFVQCWSALEKFHQDVEECTRSTANHSLEA